LTRNKSFRAFRVYFAQFKHRGGFGFLRQSLWKLLLILGAFAIVFSLFNHYLLDDDLKTWIKEELSPAWLVITLFLSECFLGILPPDLYIWAVKSYENHWLWVFVLSISSYIGGIVSYYIGTWLFKLPRVQHWVLGTYHDQFGQIRKYGGVLISIAALTPLPYSPVSMVAGIVKYPFKNYLLFGIMRIVRFFLYALVIYGSSGLFKF
jgi:membrane protein YqaA with SNARE-associated domain